jgi:translation initiation factor 3 subunit D
VRGDWPVIIEFSKNQLEKLNPVVPTLVGTPLQCGDMFKYDADLDKSRTYKPIALNPFQGEVFTNVSTLDDPVMKRLAQGNKADIFATEIAVSAIMTAPKSLYSWDVVIKRYQDKIFIDKRDDPNMLDYHTVNETSHDTQPVDDDSVNGVRQIMDEAVKANNYLLYQQYLKGDDKKHSFPEKDPFIEVEGQVAVR